MWDKVTREFVRMTQKHVEKRQIYKKWSDMKNVDRRKALTEFEKEIQHNKVL